MPRSNTTVQQFNHPGDALFGVHRLTIEVPPDTFIRQVTVGTKTHLGASASLQAVPSDQVLGRQDVLVAWALAALPGSRVEYWLEWTEMAIAPGTGRAILFEHIGFNGRLLDVVNGKANLLPDQFNDTASSLVVLSGRWVLYRDINHERPYGAGPLLTVLGPGAYPWLPALGIGNDEVSSLRAIAWP